jgi:hypothetical protein
MVHTVNIILKINFINVARGGFNMKIKDMGKDENIGFRTSTEIKKILDQLAAEGYRTLSQQCEMIILRWLTEHGHIKPKK